MTKNLLTSLLFISFIFLSGCQEYNIIPEETQTIMDKGLVYSLAPYSNNIHQQVKIYNLLTNKTLSTTFLLRIKNTNETPMWTKINNSFVLVDNAQIQHKPVESSYPLLTDILNKNNYKELSYSELKNMNLELERLQERDITSSNAYLYNEELKTLQTKIYSLERNQSLQMELQKTEKEVQHVLETYGFKDQLIYPNSEIISILIFPTIINNQNQSFVINFTLDNSKLITIPYKILQTN
ncbi:MAG: hypothetical protein PHF25_02365 [Candidatus Margulisbacteria bacterium]|nr:hypothetical protein [Candidatus Margulisiibacteriota bacterium]